MDDMLRISPNPKLVSLMDYAIDEMVARLHPKNEYGEWLAWAASWKSGERSPRACVDVAHRCFERKDNPLYQCPGQIAWGAKEACYDSSKSGWLVVRYISDAMLSFGVAFPNDGRATLDPPTLDHEP